MLQKWFFYSTYFVIGCWEEELDETDWLVEKTEINTLTKTSTDISLCCVKILKKFGALTFGAYLSRYANPGT